MTIQPDIIKAIQNATDLVREGWYHCPIASRLEDIDPTLLTLWQTDARGANTE
jgi:hypothetical protein